MRIGACQTQISTIEQYFDRSEALNILKTPARVPTMVNYSIERRRSENLTLDDSRLKSANFDASEGFGLRAVRGEVMVCAFHRNDRSRAETGLRHCWFAAGQGSTPGQCPQPKQPRTLWSFDPTEKLRFAKVDS